MHVGHMLLALVSYLKDILGCPLSSVTLAIRCVEENNHLLSLLDLERLGKPSEFGVWGKGFCSSKENGSSLFQPGDLVKIFVLYDVGFFT